MLTVMLFYFAITCVYWVLKALYVLSGYLFRGLIKLFRKIFT